MTVSDSVDSEQANQGAVSRLGARLRRALRAAVVPVLAVLLALLLGAIILLISGVNPLEAYGALLQGAFGNPIALRRTLEKSTPLIFSGLAVAFAFKGGLFNIGAQGQLLLGAVVAAGVGFGVRGLPAIIHLPLALLAGAATGALYGAIPGALKARTGAHEVITTIMLNFIAINISDYLADGPWKDNSGTNIVARTPLVLPTAEIPALAFVPLGFLLGVLMAVVVWYILFKTTIGYEVRTVGLSANAARYAGIRVAFNIVLSMTISGALAGLGGAVETLGVVGRFQPGFNVGLGFEGITVALLAKANPFGVIPAALLLGTMAAGSSNMQFNAGAEAELTDILAALMLFFVSADLIIRKILGSRAPEEEEEVTLSTGWGG